MGESGAPCLPILRSSSSSSENAVDKCNRNATDRAAYSSPKDHPQIAQTPTYASCPERNQRRESVLDACRGIFPSVGFIIIG